MAVATVHAPGVSNRMPKRPRRTESPSRTTFLKGRGFVCTARAGFEHLSATTYRIVEVRELA
jgi:hypothetical protein